jgi:hypothetical protein
VPVAQAATFTVDSTGDAADFSTADGVCDTDDSVGDGPCTLRAAIDQANATGGTDTMEFSIGGVGVPTISPGSALPTITAPVIIDGTTEAAGMVEVDGTNAGAGVDGLNITAGSSTVKGLVINSFGGDGIELSTNGGNTIEGNYIGTDVSGTVALGNSVNGINIEGSANNMIGGTAAGEGNVISGNFRGIAMAGSGVTGNVVQGNLVGTDVNGTADLGNSSHGINIEVPGNNTIGGTAAGAGNVISGNGGSGIRMFAATGVVVQGNYIGTAVNGTSALGNSRDGVIIFGGFSNTIGGTEAGAGNVISGNNSNGVFIDGADGNVVQGNLIGTDVSGTTDLGNAQNGVKIFASFSNTIGGTEAGAGNVISGNNSNGVWIDHATLSDPSPSNLVQGNYIGTDVTGTSALGNLQHGVLLQASNATIGGVAMGTGNTIAFNGGDGVFVELDPRNTIRGNSIHTNAGLGIELGIDGVTANDPDDGDNGPNNLQNYPALTLATSGPATTTIGGDLDSLASTAFTIEFFSNIGCDPSGNGEGQSFLGSTMVTTDVNGDASFSVSFGSAVPAGQVITATATDETFAAGSTSEFSACEAVTLDSDDDGVPDTIDNCPDRPNAGQENAVHAGTPEGDACENPDGDGFVDAVDNCPDTATVWFVPAGDDDCDGWSTDDEGSIGTDPNLACSTDNWPPDFDGSHIVDIFDVSALAPPVFFSETGDPDYTARRDIGPDGIIDIFDVSMMAPPIFFATCTP